MPREQNIAAETDKNLDWQAANDGQDNLKTGISAVSQADHPDDVGMLGSSIGSLDARTMRQRFTSLYEAAMDEHDAQIAGIDTTDAQAFMSQIAAAIAAVLPPAMLANLTAAQWRMQDDPQEKRRREMEADYEESLFRERRADTERRTDRDNDLRENSYQQAMQDRQERELAEWQQTRQSFAGQTMTGAEWGKLGDSLKDGSKGRSWLMDYLMLNQGMTEAEAERMANDMQLAASGMSKPEGQRTEDERDAIKRMKDNPEAAAAYHAVQDAQNKGFPPIARDTAIATRAGQTASVQAGADAFSNDVKPTASAQETGAQRSTNEQESMQRIEAKSSSNGLHEDAISTRQTFREGADDLTAAGFASAPKLTAHHQAAVAAIEPLDTPKPVQLAAVAPQPNASAGLEI